MNINAQSFPGNIVCKDVSMTNGAEFESKYRKAGYIISGPLVGLFRIIANFAKIVFNTLSLIKSENREAAGPKLERNFSDLARGTFELVPFLGAGVLTVIHNKQEKAAAVEKERAAQAAAAQAAAQKKLEEERAVAAAQAAAAQAAAAAAQKKQDEEQAAYVVTFIRGVLDTATVQAAREIEEAARRYNPSVLMLERNAVKPADDPLRSPVKVRQASPALTAATS